MAAVRHIEMAVVADQVSSLLETRITVNVAPGHGAEAAGRNSLSRCS